MRFKEKRNLKAIDRLIESERDSVYSNLLISPRF
ncbi:MAG: Uncharacterized protein XD94_1707 [Mesotoga prima]|uniref:Uncharacterized protein n=1 Tax=Mesotoga prima TaxID=1184387 RepID=A0A101HKG9_9BACT|nr:MAG: Uncharacterized protein XD94_1707 [Mesotoga prima]